MRKTSYVGDFKAEVLRQLAADGEVQRVRVRRPDGVIQAPLNREAGAGIGIRVRKSAAWRGREIRCNAILLELWKRVQTGESWRCGCRRDWGSNPGGETERATAVKRIQQTRADTVIDHPKATADNCLVGFPEQTLHQPSLDRGE